MKKKGNKKMPTPIIHNPIPTSLFLSSPQCISYVFSLPNAFTTNKQNSEQRCRDGVMNEFVSWCRHLLVSFLFHELTSLHPPSFHRNDFSTCKNVMLHTFIDSHGSSSSNQGSRLPDSQSASKGQSKKTVVIAATVSSTGFILICCVVIVTSVVGWVLYRRRKQQQQKEKEEEEFKLLDNEYVEM